MLHRARGCFPSTPLRFNFFEGFALGFRHQEEREEPGPDGHDPVQPERGRFTQDLRERQKRQGHDQVGAPIGDRPDAHGPTADAQGVNL